MSFVLFNVAFTILGHIMMLPTCSNDLCMVLPYLNAMPQTRDMTSLHMTLYHGVIPSEFTRWSPRRGLGFSLKLGTIIHNISNAQISNFTLIQ